MTEELKELAQDVMDDKREEGADERQARELYDVPTESVSELASQQSEHERSR
jgi:hypothetical protein